jgi:hypothetical protein
MEKKWPDVGKYKWQRMASLTVKEGAALEELYTQFGCANVSQFCKKIVHGEIEIAGANVNVVKPEPICTKEELKELQAIKRKYESICRIINT